MEKEQRRPYGVLGRTLGHSYTPVIYRELAGLDYRKFEREPDEVESFIRGDEWEGVNVTIPYKKDVVPYLDVLTRRPCALATSTPSRAYRTVGCRETTPTTMA